MTRTHNVRVWKRALAKAVNISCSKRRPRLAQLFRQSSPSIPHSYASSWCKTSIRSNLVVIRSVHMCAATCSHAVVELQVVQQEVPRNWRKLRQGRLLSNSKPDVRLRSKVSRIWQVMLTCLELGCEGRLGKGVWLRALMSGRSRLSLSDESVDERLPIRPGNMPSVLYASPSQAAGENGLTASARIAMTSWLRVN